jgi:ubiquinone/menaquinone biosynthesis C-methylase UbiE
MELAKLSRGEVVALDIDEALLEELDRKLIAEGLSSCVTTKKGSMLNIDFPDESFDLIWAEGSISFIGFVRGLREWKRLLRPSGFLVVHTETKRVTGELEKLSSCGYRLFAQFALPEAAHWTEYYRPLEIRVNRLLAQGNGNLEARRLLRKLQKEIDMVKRNPRRYSSAFYILRKL